MEVFKAMLDECLAKASVLEHHNDVSYGLQIEVKYLIAVIEDMKERMGCNELR